MFIILKKEDHNYMTQNKNINIVKGAKLCTGCGICISMCPVKCIKNIINKRKGIYEPLINDSKCINCGLCYKVCPGKIIDVATFNNTTIDGNDSLIGHHLKIYKGHIKNKKLLSCATSGGMIRQILIYAFEKKIITKALICIDNPDDILKPKMIIANNTKELNSASKSKYCPISIDSVLKNITKSKHKYAIVGLPCHIQGIKLAEENNNKIKEKIVLHLGLLCNHTATFNATKFILNKHSIKNVDVKNIDYRFKDKNKFIKIDLKKSKCIKVPYSYWCALIFPTHFFTPRRCTFCSDATNEFSDISFGDAGTIEIDNKLINESYIIVRTQKGMEIIKQILEDNLIKIRPVKKEEVIKEQKGMLYLKKNLINARLHLLGLKTHKIKRKIKTTILDYIIAFLLIMNRNISEVKQGYIIMITPDIFIKIYSKFISYTISYISKFKLKRNKL